MKNGKLALVLAVAVGLAHAVLAATNVLGIVYSTVPAAEGRPATDLKLDLFVPQGEGPFPCFIYIHGGSWKAGSRKNCRYAAPLDKLGWAVASIDYRLTEGGLNPFPAQISDCKEAIRFLRANAVRFNLDSGLFCVAGSSAGGHLAALAGVTSGYDAVCRLKPVEDPASTVAAAVVMYGPTDLREMAAPMIAFARQHPDLLPKESGEKVGPANLRELAAPLLALSRQHPGAIPKGVEDGIALFGTTDIDKAVELIEEASPVAYLEGHPSFRPCKRVGGARLPTAKMPRFLILHSKGDPLVPVAQGELLHAALEKAGVKSELHLYDFNGHSLPPQSMAHLEAFLRSLREETAIPR